MKAVVKRHLGRQAQQLLLRLALGLDRAAVAPDVVAPGFLVGRDGFGRFVRAVLPARCPQNNQFSALNLFKTQHWEIRRLNQLAGGQQLLLNFVQLVVGQPHGRKHRLTMRIAILPDHHITATQVLEIVGKRAHSADDCIRIPAGFVFDALAFDSALAQQVGEVDGEFGHVKVWDTHGMGAVLEAAKAHCTDISLIG